MFSSITAWEVSHRLCNLKNNHQQSTEANNRDLHGNNLTLQRRNAMGDLWLFI